MQLIYEFIPLVLFFAAFKWYGIYAATVVGMAATAIMVLIFRFIKKTWDKKQLVTLGIFVLFGSLTLYFHDPIFIKWKPTVLFWLFALAILFTQLFTAKPLMQRVMEELLPPEQAVPLQVWRNLNLGWAMAFFVLGAVNLYVAYTFSNEVWVNYKFYGVTLIFVVLSVAQALLLSRYIEQPKS